MRKRRQSRRTKNREKAKMSCTTAPAEVAVAILFNLTIISWYLIVVKVCCPYVQAD